MAGILDAIPWILFFGFLGGLAVVVIPLALVLLFYRPMPMPRRRDME